MAELSRGPDYLRLHANVRGRVRNLETGVHPTGSDLRYYDTYPPTDIAVRAAADWHSLDAFNNFYPARWQRRTGLVMLSGAVILESGATVPEQQHIATLPPEAAPMQAVQIQVTADRSPFRTFIGVEPDGKLHLFGGEFTDETASVTVFLDGAMWAVN